MGSRPFPQIPCVICKKPVNLQADLWADEDGKAVHADCYVQRIISSYLAETWANSFLFPRTQGMYVDSTCCNQQIRE